MPSIFLTGKAKEDLKGIARYTEKNWGHSQRTVYLHLLDNGFKALAENPLLGMDCTYIREAYRKHSVGKHIIFYRKLEGGIEIVRILHESMDVAQHLQL